MRNSTAKVRTQCCFGRLGWLSLANKTACATAENALKQEEKKPQYSLQLLKIVAEQSIPVQTRLAASLAFKNFVRLNYVVCQGQHFRIQHMGAAADANRV